MNVNETRTVDLMDHERHYLLRLLDAQWGHLDRERGDLSHHSDEYRQRLAEQARIERLQEKLR